MLFIDIIKQFINYFSDFLNSIMNIEYYYLKEISDVQNLHKYNINNKNTLSLQFIINSYIEDHSIFKNLRYIEDYSIFNNVGNKAIYEIENLKGILIYIEGFIIVIQKIFYDFFIYFSQIFNWYIDYKILLDKTIVTSNFVEDLHYNISLELLMDIQNEHLKSLLFLFTENHFIGYNYNLKYDLYIALFKNYSQMFKENPYKVCLELINLYKNYPRSTILSYGLNYDINILQNNKYLFSLLDVNVSNKNKLSKLNIHYDIFDAINNYEILNYHVIDKSQKNYNSMMSWALNTGNTINDYSIIDITTNKYNEIFLNKLKESHNWYTRKYFWFSPEYKDILNEDYTNEFSTFFGGYSYWWGWHQDAVYIHGNKGPGGAPLWDDYIKWKISRKYKFFLTYIPKHIKKIKHGVKLYRYYPGMISKKLPMFQFDWDIYKKKKFAKFIIHGRRVWELEKLFFKNFIFSNDLWVQKFYNLGGDSTSRMNVLTAAAKKFFYNFDITTLETGKYDRSIFIKFGINSPDIFPKKKSLYSYWFSFLNEDDNLAKRISWKKNRMYQYIFSVLENYYNLSLKMHEDSMKGIRGFLMKQFTIDFWLKKDKLCLINYTYEPKITWDMFYTNIESITEPLNLSYINKNFYGRHLYERMDIFLLKSNELYSDIKIPRNTNLLLKKSYIENLIYVYQREEEPMINYIKYKLNYMNLIWIFDGFDDYLWFIWENIKEIFEILGGELYKDIWKGLSKIKQLKYLREQYNVYEDYFSYFWVLFLILFYCFISSILVVLIKSFLPKNIIYGIRTSDQSSLIQNIKIILENINNKVYTNKISSDYMDDILSHYNKMAQIMNLKKFDNKFYTESELYNKFYKDKDSGYFKAVGKIIDEKPDESVTWEDFNRKLKDVNLEDKMYIKKNFFDSEHRFIYSWEKRLDKVFEDNLNNNTLKKNLPFSRIKDYNKMDAKKIKDLAKNYNIFYKTLVFEKNLEKWENNTKLRADILLWAKYLGTSFFGLMKGLFLYYRDRRFNHNRTIFWEDPLLEKESKVTYYFTLPKIFFNIFFAIRFIIGAIKLWDYKYWIKRWRQYVSYGIHARVSYKDLKGRLEKEWTIEWYKDLTDYGAGMFYKDYTKVVKKFNDIKATPADRDALVNQTKRSFIINNILLLTFESDKYKAMTEYLESMRKIEKERLINNFDLKFKDIRKKLILDVDKISPKQWAEQRLMYKYRDIVMEKKIAVELDEYEELKQSYTRRVSRDFTDDDKTLVILEWDHQKHIKAIMDTKIAAVRYEKQLREFNFDNMLVDPALDSKDKVFFESIDEYKKELAEEYDKLDQQEKEERELDSVYERKSRKLFGILETHYLWYRWYTTMGSRLNFLLSQIYGIFVGWVENVQKIRKNEHSVESLILIMYTDFSEFIYKMYWEYLVIWKKYNTLKRLGYSFFEIIKFGIILTPILIYTGSLYILLFVYIFFKLIIEKLNINIYLKKFWNNYIQIFLFNIKNYILLIFNILFRDLKTGYSVFDIIYIKFYNVCGWIQRNLYFIKGAFFLGYNENGSIILGLKKIILYIILKYKAYIEQRKLLKRKKNKKFFQEILDWYKVTKNSIFIKMELLLLIIDIKNFFIKSHWNFITFIYENIVYPIFKTYSKIFYSLYSKNITLLKHYYTLYLNNIYTLINLISKINLYEFIILFIKRIFVIITLPIRFIINHQKWKYVKNYKKGIQGFRDNPMYIIINNPRTKKDWRLKLHNLLINHTISKFLRELKINRDSLLEVFLMYKVEEVRWANKNTFQEHFWKSWYWNVKTMKEKTLTFLISLMTNIENNYKSFEYSIETKNWSFWERFKYAYYVNKVERNINTFDNQKRISRDLFFYKKVKERRKLMRRYFLKGLINWFTYITINKIIFTKLEHSKLRRKRIKNVLNVKYRYVKYKTPALNKTVHLTEYLSSVPPQLWSLVILYDIYFKYILRFHFRPLNYPKDWYEGLEHKRAYKWRLAAPGHIYNIPFILRRRIGADSNTYHFGSFIQGVATPPFDPILRWLVFLLEYGFSYEDLNIHNEKTWGDISLSHLFTYNTRLDAYQYEIKDFNRLLKGYSWFIRAAEDSLEDDKAKYYKERFELVSKNLMFKNKKVLEDVLERRRLKSAKILHKALLRHKVRTDKEKEADLEEERNRDYFYAKKREFFDILKIEHYFEWQAEFESKNPEAKYFSTKDIETATFNAHLSEDYHNAHGLPIPYSYMFENIVLKSFDQTLEEISYFLKFSTWQIMSKKNKNKKKYINYKNLYIKPSFFKRINYLEYKVAKTEINEKTNESKTFFVHKYEPLNWEPLMREPMFNFIENNFFTIYGETGTLYTYSDKIKFNDHAQPYYKDENKFHVNDTLLRFAKVIHKRKLDFKDIKNMTWKKKK